MARCQRQTSVVPSALYRLTQQLTPGTVLNRESVMSRYTDYGLRSAIDRGHLVRILPGVFAVPPADTFPARATAACLWAGSPQHSHRPGRSH